MPYLVDGNNVLGLLAGKPRPSEEERQELLRLLAARLRDTRGRVLVVFDGPAPAGRPESALGPLSVRYSGARSADDVLVEAVSRSRSPADFFVVTDDRGLAARARTAGARTVPVREFVERCSRPAARADRVEPVDVGAWMEFFGDDRNRIL